MENDPFGQSFLERIAKTPDRTRLARLGKIEGVLKVCVPNMKNLRFDRDAITGSPHLEAMYAHWRPDAGWQRESQFSDGTLRLLGIMWSLLDGDSLLLLEEPELSLNEDIVRRIPPLIWKIQRHAKYRRQVFITTHSEALLADKGIDPREVIRLEPTQDGTKVIESTDADKALIKACGKADEVVLYCFNHAAEVWWKGMESKLSRPKNLSVLRIPTAASQALIPLAQRSMQLQATIQEGVLTLGDSAHTVDIEPVRWK